MTTQLSMNDAGTRLTIVDDSRVHPAVPAQTEDYRITVEIVDKLTGEVKSTSIFTGTREVTPAQPGYTDPIRVTDDSGVIWSALSDDGKTAVYGRS